MHSKRTVNVLLTLTLGFALLLPAFAMAQDATEEPVEPAATEEAMMDEVATEEAMVEEDVTVNEVTIEAPAFTEEPVEEATPAPAATNTSTESGDPREYTIIQGDTLFSIARRNNVSVTELARINNITNPERIFWGQSIIIPDSSGTGGPTPPDEDSDERLVSYRVAEGDTLYRIAIANGTTVTRLLEINDDIDDANIIFIGQELLVPEES